MKKNFTWLYRANSLGLSYRNIGVLTSLSLITTITEIFGIGIFLPVFQFIRLDGNMDALISSSTLWQHATDIFNFVNIELSLLTLLFLSLSFFLLRQVLSYFRMIYNAAIRQRIIQSQRNRVFNGYIDADASYHDKTPVGGLVNIVTTEVNSAVMGLMAPIELLTYIIMLLGYLFMLSILSWQMTLLSSIVLILTSRVPNIWIKKSAHIGRKLVGANTSVSEFLVERLQSPRLIRLSGTEIAEKNDFYNLTQLQRKYSVFNSILQARTEVVMEPIIIILSLVFLYFSHTVLHLKIEAIGLYLVIALRLLPVVKGIISQWNTVQRFLGSIEIIENRLSDVQSSVEIDSGFEIMDKLRRSVFVDSVSYHYPKTKNNVLKDITIKFDVNSITAIVGPSGGGKSTLIDLLPSLRVPTKGSIYFDGVNIKKYTLKSIREKISYAPQTPQIFNGTIKSHILYGKPNATHEEVVEAAHLAGAKGFISQLPEGFETILDEGAVNLSGGQKQRLDLARVLIKKSPILILDEPTSNLDAETEKAFRQVLRNIRKKTNTLIVIVAHRLASISDSDRIIVLNQGVVESFGTHSELLNCNEWYAKAWQTQGVS